MVDTGRDLLRCAAERAGADGDHDTDDPDANGRFPFDPDTVDIADGDVLDRLEGPVREWWVDEFGRYVGRNGGFFTPPQREAIPLVDDGTNALVCAPTGGRPSPPSPRF